MQYTEKEIEEFLERMVKGEEGISDDPVVHQLLEMYKERKAEFRSCQKALFTMRDQLAQLEVDKIKLEGQTNELANLLRKFYTKSLEKTEETNNDSGSQEAC